jgi:hypothetical protein
MGVIADWFHRSSPLGKEIDFDYRKLFSIQYRTENNSKQIARVSEKI